jgi:hypothetical protein
MTLLRIDFLLKLQTYHRDNPTQQERGQHMAERGQQGYFPDPQEGPALSPRDDCQRHPVIRQNRMKNGYQTSGPN